MPHCRRARARSEFRRILGRYHSPKGGGLGSSCTAVSSRRDTGRGRRNRPFSVLVFLAARTERNPEEQPREAPEAHPAPGSILPHKPVNWQTADGQVHFSSGVSALRYGRAMPFRDGGGLDVDCSVVGGDPAGWSRERAHGGLRCSPPPVSFASLSVVQSSPVLARLGLIVREAATARGLPHPGTARGVDGLEGVGEGAGGMTWGEGDVLPSNLGGEGRDFRRAGATMGGQARDTWAQRQAPPPGLVKWGAVPPSF